MHMIKFNMKELWEVLTLYAMYRKPSNGNSSFFNGSYMKMILFRQLNQMSWTEWCITEYPDSNVWI